MAKSNWQAASKGSLVSTGIDAGAVRRVVTGAEVARILMDLWGPLTRPAPAGASGPLCPPKSAGRLAKVGRVTSPRASRGRSPTFDDSRHLIEQQNFAKRKLFGISAIPLRCCAAGLIASGPRETADGSHKCQ